MQEANQNTTIEAQSGIAPLSCCAIARTLPAAFKAYERAPEGFEAQAFNRMIAAEDLLLATRPASLQDAVAIIYMVAARLARLAQSEAGDCVPELATLADALPSALFITASSAGVDLYGLGFTTNGTTAQYQEYDALRASHGDAELLRLIAEFDAIERQIVELGPRGANAIADDDERERAEAPLKDAQAPLMDRICELRATTPAGWAARGRGLALWLGEQVAARARSDCWDDRMISALLRDLTAPHASPDADLIGPCDKIEDMNLSAVKLVAEKEFADKQPVRAPQPKPAAPSRKELADKYTATMAAKLATMVRMLEVERTTAAKGKKATPSAARSAGNRNRKA